MTTTSLGSTGDPVLRAIMRRDRLSQSRDAERVGIADAGVVERPPRRLAHRLRRRRAGLADFEMDDIGTRRLALGRGAQHVHRDKRRHQTSAGSAQGHSTKYPSSTANRAWLRCSRQPPLPAKRLPLPSAIGYHGRLTAARGKSKMTETKPARLIGMSGSLRAGSYSNAVLETLREKFAGVADLTVLGPGADPALQPGFRRRKAPGPGQGIARARSRRPTAWFCAPPNSTTASPVC